MSANLYLDEGGFNVSIAASDDQTHNLGVMNYDATCMDISADNVKLVIDVGGATLVVEYDGTEAAVGVISYRDHGQAVTDVEIQVGRGPDGIRINTPLLQNQAIQRVKEALFDTLRRIEL